MPSRLPLACKGGMGGVLRVEIVVLATPTPILAEGRHPTRLTPRDGSSASAEDLLRRRNSYVGDRSDRRPVIRLSGAEIGFGPAIAL